MKIKVEVSVEELDEMGLTPDELKHSIIYDLDYDADDRYVGYNVEVIVND